MAVTSLSRQRRRHDEIVRLCGGAADGCGLLVAAEGDDAPLRWWVRDVSPFQRRGTLTSGLTNPGERVSPMTDPAFQPASDFSRISFRLSILAGACFPRIRVLSPRLLEFEHCM